jgi:2-keto-3-deoxy-L-rhamnonate aldolase RhmA
MSEIRSNTVRDKLMAGDAAFGFMAFEFFSPGLFSIAAQAGAEYIVLDMEHSGAGPDTMKDQFAFARGTGVMPLVRVPGLAHHLIAPMLDAGAMGIMVPLVETAEQARSVVDACRYRPQGRRGLAFSMAHDDYAAVREVRATIEAANQRTLVIALIESAKGIANADAIMATPGIDVGWFGHYDFTDSMGFAGDFARPEFNAAVETLVAACNKHGKAAGFLAGDVETALAWRAKGFRCLAYGTDVALFRDALSRGLSALHSNEKGACGTR